jgi:Ser/Thr protein kinase RdoA (MazF antagonist)
MTSGVVRVGSTVRRPAGPWTDAVDALLAHVHAVGATGAPRPLGRDDRGRQVLEFVEGEARGPREEELADVGRLLRDLHEATASFVPPDGARWQQVIAPDRVELVAHNDTGAWNLVRRPTGEWALVDWDLAGPGSRLWDLALTAQSAVPLVRGRPTADAGRGLRVLVDGYGLDEADRHALPGLLTRRVEAMVGLLRAGAASGTAPWDRIWLEDGAHWQDTAAYLAAREREWLAALLG